MTQTSNEQTHRPGLGGREIGKIRGMSPRFYQEMPQVDGFLTNREVMSAGPFVGRDETTRRGKQPLLAVYGKTDMLPLLHLPPYG